MKHKGAAMRRREFITLVGGAATAWPLVAQAQPAAMPVIGFLHSGSPEPNAKRVAGFRKGLSDAGLVEGKNVAIEFCWAGGQDDKLPALAKELIDKRVAVIATLSSTTAAIAAKAATSTIPIYFLIADPPVDLGLVSSLNRPGGNATGITTLAAELAAKRLSLLRELVPQASGMAVLLKPSHPSAKAVTASLQTTASALNVQLDVLEASTDAEIEKAYGSLKPGAAMLVATDPFFFIRRTQLTALSARHAVPTIYDSREFGEAGGLMSYGPNHVRLWGQAGTYVVRILKGEKPADLPVTQASIFEMVINLKAAKPLGLAVPSSMLALADEVIE
jgi:putative tryptophan/tyrosine transport system substrate-binding protein